MPFFAFSTSPLAALINPSNIEYTLLPTYPSFVYAVASALNTGTPIFSLIKFTISVFPVPDGPAIRICDLFLGFFDVELIAIVLVISFTAFSFLISFFFSL